MPLSDFQLQLEKQLKRTVKLKINDNRSTMLSVKWDPICTKISLHRFFLAAPPPVMNALLSYVKKRGRTMDPCIKAFIEENVKQLDYSHLLDKNKLEVEGRFHHLQDLMCKVNQEYFNCELDLNITWFTAKKRGGQSQITFGLYHDPLKLIKINRILDTAECPEYVVSFVIYHEMLHAVHPSYVKDGRRRIHNKEFKQEESQYRFYNEAKEWIKYYQECVFH